MEQKKKGRLIGLRVAVIVWVIVMASSAIAGPDRLHLLCDAWPPYQIVEKDGIFGFSTQVVRSVLGRMGVRKVRIEAYPWKRAVAMVARGRADGLFSANDTPERREFAYYPGESLVVSPWVMWRRKEDRLTIKSWEDLKGLTVGLVGGYSYTPEFWQFLRAHGRYEEVVDDLHNFKKLSAGRVDVIVAEGGNGRYLMEQLNIRGIVPVKAAPVKVDGLYLIFSRKRVSRVFVDQFSRQLTVFKQTPAFDGLYQSYFKGQAWEGGLGWSRGNKTGTKGK